MCISTVLGTYFSHAMQLNPQLTAAGMARQQCAKKLVGWASEKRKKQALLQRASISRCL